MQNLTPTLNEDQLKQNIDAMQKQGADNPTVQSYVNNYQLDPTSGSYTLKQAPSQPNPSGALFPAAPGDSAGTSALKTIGNIPSSTFGFIKGALNTINPFKTADTVQQIATPSDNGVKVSPLDVAKEIPGAAYQTLVPQFLQHLFKGDTQSAQASIENDPVGQIAPLVLGAEGGAKVLDSATGIGEAANGATARNMARALNAGDGPIDPSTMETQPTTFKQSLDNGVSRITGAIADPITKITDSIKNGIGTTAASFAGTLLGLGTDDIKNVIQNPEAFSKVAQDSLSRGGLAGELNSSINQRLNDLSSTGKGYEPIRADTTTQINTPENFIPQVLQKYGLSLDGEGKVIADTNSITRNPSDLNAIQNFVNNWKDKATMTPNEFLNMRSDIGGIAKFGKDIGSNMDAAKVAKDLYATANDTMRPQVPNLKELDSVYAPEKQATLAMKKEFLNKDGTLKDGAAAKIANATKPGREAVLNRLETIAPGITKRIQLMNTVEAIQKAQKSGLLREGIEGATVGHFASPIAGIAVAIITHPDIAIPLLRGLGWSAEKVTALTNTLSTLAGASLSDPAFVASGVASSNQKQ